MGEGLNGINHIFHHQILRSPDKAKRAQWGLPILLVLMSREGLTRHLHVPRPYWAALRAVKNASFIFYRTKLGCYIGECSDCAKIAILR